MKSNTHFKSLLLYSILSVMIIVGAASCNSDGTPKAKMAEADESIETADTLTKDVQFLIKAAEFNLEDIWLGQLAQEKSKNAYVKELGKMMERDHRKSLDGLTALAKNKSVTIPIVLSYSALYDYKVLNNKSGIDFDSSYCVMMVNQHKDALAMFEMASVETDDSEIKKWAILTMPVISKHIIHTNECRAKLKKYYNQ